ncbi:hypothetical protein FGO68_gene6263 [Halteria grandinella]|uniref:GS catalytic domain-containing protein n=1 Tax=Halteria grandinella TaxID=5974 RepID=A0A8J8T1I2_HALGN|nr:hypothetical protein FGO68_gene6263 [Halteria grandinella]
MVEHFQNQIFDFNCVSTNTAQSQQSPEFVYYLWQTPLGFMKQQLINNSIFKQESQTLKISPHQLSTIDQMRSEDIRVIPDKQSLKICSNKRKIGFCMVKFENQDGNPHELCMRSLLQKETMNLRKNFGAELRIGFSFDILIGQESKESKFQQLGSKHSKIFNFEEDFLALASQLNQSGSELEQISQCSTTPGKFRISIKQDEACKSIDTFLCARILITRQFKDYRVSFLPKTLSDYEGNDVLLNMSLWKLDGVPAPVNITGDQFSMYKLSEGFASFLSGILEQLPALTAFLIPHHNGLHRIMEERLSKVVGWSYQSDAIMKVNAPPQNSSKSTSKQVESITLNMCDHSANLYLAVSQIIACGIDGIKRQLKLQPPIEQIKEKLSHIPLKMKERKEFIGRPIKISMGASLIERYFAMQAAEQERYEGMTFDQEVSLMIDQF